MKDTILIGRKPVVDALESDTRLEKLWIDKDMRGELEKYIRRMSREKKVPLQYVPKQKLAALCKNANHQGLAAQLSIVEYYTVDQLLPHLFEQGKTPFLLVLDGIEDVRNLGALARSAVWFDCDAIVIPEKKSAIINSFAYKASAGAIKDIALCRESNFKDAMEYIKASGLKVVLAEANEEDHKNSVNLTEPIALVLGSESSGISKDIKSMGDAYMSIQGSGRVESLNVSVAGALLMHEIYKLRNSIK